MYNIFSTLVAEIGELEATRLQHESTIQDLSARLESTQERLNMLETSKRALESRVGETEFQASNQIKVLEQVKYAITFICTFCDSINVKYFPYFWYIRERTV